MDKGILKGNLVDKYWQDYKKGLHKRKNRKTKNLPVHRQNILKVDSGN